MNDILSLREKTKNLTVLYVEDEDTIRKQVGDILGDLFDKVVVAGNGQMGFDLFMQHRPDMVITDIQMPVMNGIEMAKRIKGVFPDIPILVTTAFSDESYFLACIEIGIDRYILKPIMLQNFMQAITSVVERLDGKRAAKQLEEMRTKERLNSTAQETMSTIANAFPSPAVVVSDGHITFMNQAFFSILDSKTAQALANGGMSLDNILEKKDGYLESFGKCDKNDHFANKISVKIEGKRYIFLVAVSDILVGETNEKATLYSLSNITAIEYQKQKNKRYAELLQELLFTHYRPSVVASQLPQDEKKFLLLSSEDRQVLHRSRTQKTDAATYVHEIEGTVLDELEELAEIESELVDGLEQLQDFFSTEILSRIAERLRAYSSTIALLFEFSDLAHAIESLSIFLDNLTREQLEGRARDMLAVYLASICMDLANWRTTIFIEKIANDIHYLDSSLFSSCLQLQMALSADKDQDVEGSDELELF